MVHILSIPENVMVQQLFPLLHHNDILRLRRVSKQTKVLADTYLWTPTPGHQGKWVLEINASQEDKTLQAFLRSGLPPPSRLVIINITGKGSSEQRSFFEDDHLEEFMERYGKYVTHLTIDELRIPFTSRKEIDFFESLVNLESLQVSAIRTVGGAAQFEEKTRNAEGSFLIRPTFKKLKAFSLTSTDCMDSMWNFIHGLSDKLNELSHPFKQGAGDGHWDEEDYNLYPESLVPVPFRELIERRGLNRQGNLLYDWGGMSSTILQSPVLLTLFASCYDNGVMIKNLPARFLKCLIYEELDAYDYVRVRREDIDQRFLFVGTIIYSMIGQFYDNVFLMELPSLKELKINCGAWWQFIAYGSRNSGYPKLPNLTKLCVKVTLHRANHLLEYLCGRVNRPHLEELSLKYSSKIVRMGGQLPLPNPWALGNRCGNLRKLTVGHCSGDDNFFVALWKGLPLLEDVTLSYCWNLTNQGFVGEEVEDPVLLKLEKLKHLSLGNLEMMKGITNVAFRNVFRHLKLSSFELISEEPIGSITKGGIEELLSGPFAESIEKLKLGQLKLEGVSEKELQQVESCFRSSHML